MTDDFIRNPERLAALHRLLLLDTPTEPAFDRLTRLASRILKAPVSLISLIDTDRQFIKSAVGISEPLASHRQLPLSHSVCKHMVATGQPLIIENASDHPLAYDNPLIPEFGVRSYAGIPLVIPPQDIVIGSFCVIDVVPRVWSEDEIAILQDLAASVMSEIILRSELIERRQAQEAMKESEERYKALFERSLDAVIITDFEGNFTDANNAALQLLGYTREEFLAFSLASILSQDQLSAAIDILAEIAETGFQKEVGEFRVRTKTGQEIIAHQLASAIYHDSKPWAVQTIVRDVTAQKQAEQTLRSAYDKEKELRKLRSEFMSMLSHDFRTPLAIILSSADILKNYADRLTDAQKSRHLNIIENQVTRQLDLLNDILLLNQSESVGLGFNPAPCDLEKFCCTLIEDHQLTVGTLHPLVFTKMCEDTNAQIDEKLLQRAISNLLSNAVKYSPEGGTIRLNLSCEGEFVVIAIHDEGIGIPESDLEHLFEPFYRAGNAGGIQGTGLGMVIVKQMIEAHSGTITIKSELGVGTTFFITLPRTQPVNTPSAQSQLPVL